MSDYELFPLMMRDKKTGKITQVGWGKKDKALVKRLIERFTH